MRGRLRGKGINERHPRALYGGAGNSNGIAFTPLVEGAVQREDGVWVDDSGAPLPVSASDVERFAYCPMSWYLAKAGNAGVGQAIERGSNCTRNAIGTWKPSKSTSMRRLAT